MMATTILGVALLGVLLEASCVSGWMGTKRSCMSMMGSRKSTKFERKMEWLDKRGYGYDGLPKPIESKIAVIGSGRIGGLLAQGGDTIVLGRNDEIDANGVGPILIATRNDALDGIVEKCPPERRKDLVFMQNGYLDAFLESKGLLENTQALLYLSVTKKGADAIDGITSVNPEGLTAATGVHAQAFADRLAVLNLKCNVVTPEQYRPAMFEKLIWISTYMLVGTAKECKSVGEAGSQHKQLVEDVIKELVAAVSAKEAITFESGTIERLAAYTDVVADFPCAVKEFEWRNQYFYDLGDEACPIHNGRLKECATKGFLSFELPGFVVEAAAAEEPEPAAVVEAVAADEQPAVTPAPVEESAVEEAVPESVAAE